MNASIAIGQFGFALPEIKKPESLQRLQNRIDIIGMEYLNWQFEHPFLSSLTKIAGGLILVAALKSTPSPEHLGNLIHHLPQNLGDLFNNFQPHSVSAAGLHEHLAQTTPQPCGMPDTLTVDAGHTFYSTVRNAIQAQGISDPAEIRKIYNEIMANNSVNIPDPSHIAAGTTVHIPHFAGCDAIQSAAQSTTTETIKTVTQNSTAVCGIPKTLTVDSGHTFYSTVRGAIQAQGISDPAEVKKYYNEVVANNVKNIPDPSNIGAGTVVNIPTFPGCGASPTEAQALAGTTPVNTLLDSSPVNPASPETSNLSGLIAIPIVGAIIAGVGGYAIWKRTH